MALTVTLKKATIFGDMRFSIVEVAFDTSYPTGGESLTARECGMSVVDFALFEPSGGYTFEYDHTNNLLKAMVAVDVVAGSGTADANNTIMKSATATLEVAGTGTAFQVKGVEVGDTTDLSAITNVRGLVVGV